MPETKEKTEATDQPTVVKKSLVSPALMGTLTKVAMFGLIGVVAVLAAYFLTLKVLKPMMASDTPTEQAAAGAKTEKAEPVKAEPAKVEKHEAAAERQSSAGGEHGGGGAEFFTVESIVVNPAETGGTRYLSCSVSFEVGSKEDLKAFEDKSVKIKDLLITILSSKTVDELADIKLRNDMRRQILTVVNRFTTPAQATAVYLTDFVLQ
ncbi:MAG: flagellar basal body-associated FliL family protein [Candidatus Zixiibacteriota bacterium]